MPPPPSSSEPRGRSPPQGSAPPAHGSAPGVAGVWFAVSGAAVWFDVSVVVVALFDGVVFCGFLLPQAGAPSIAPANTTVRQIVWVVSRFMGASVSLRGSIVAMKSAAGSTAIRDHFLGKATKDSLRGLHVALTLDEGLAAVEAPATAARSVEMMQYGNEKPSRVETVCFSRRVTLGGIDFDESNEVAFVERDVGFLTATWLLAFETAPKTMLRDAMAAARTELAARFKAKNKSTFQFVRAKRTNVVFVSSGPASGPSYLRMTLSDPEF